MRAVFYSRVSTDEQAKEGFSLAAQVGKCKAFITLQGWTLAAEYIDEGFSAKDVNRPALQQMLKDAAAGKFDVIIVYRLDRLTRSVKDLYELNETLEKHGVKFKSVTEEYDTTTAAGKLFITLTAAMAQWERENLAERIKFGIEQMFSEGKRPGAKMPYGYNKNGELIEGEAKVIRRLRELYMLGDGFKTVANKLNNEGLTRNGVLWTSYTVYYTLDNPFYAGKMRIGKRTRDGKYSSRKMENVTEVSITNHEYPTIFTWDEYEEHKKRMKSREFRGYSKKNEYWFTGILKCSRCGSSMSGRVRKNKRQDGSYYVHLSYMCTKRQMIGASGCTMPMIRQELVEKLLFNKMRDEKFDMNEVQAAARDDEQAQRIKKELDELKMQLENIKKQRKKWQYAFAEDLITASELKERNKENAEMMDEITDRIAELENEQRKETAVMRADIDELIVLWKVADDREKQQLLQTIFKEIVISSPAVKPHGKKGSFIDAEIEAIIYN